MAKARKMIVFTVEVAMDALRPDPMALEKAIKAVPGVLADDTEIIDSKMRYPKAGAADDLP